MYISFIRTGRVLYNIWEKPFIFLGHRVSNIFVHAMAESLKISHEQIQLKSSVTVVRRP